MESQKGLRCSDRYQKGQEIVISYSHVFVILKENFNFLTEKCTFPCSIACRCNIVLFSSISTPNDSNESSFASISRPNDSNGFARAQYKARKEPTPWYQSRGEEFTPLYEPYSYMLPLRIWFLHRFGLKTGIEFAHLDLEWVMFF